MKTGRENAIHIRFQILSNCWGTRLRQPNITFGQFKRSLKTFMFG